MAQANANTHQSIFSYIGVKFTLNLLLGLTRCKFYFYKYTRVIYYFVPCEYKVKFTHEYFLFLVKLSIWHFAKTVDIVAK